MKLYTCQQISKILGISIKSVYNKISTLNIQKVKTINRIAMYSNEHLFQLRNSQRGFDTKLYYPVYISTTEVYEIYESKLNYTKLELL